MTDATALFDLTTVHCFACAKPVVGVNPIDAHAAMEAHYRARHAALIARITGDTRPPAQR